MKHYSALEWQDYIDQRLPLSLRDALEEHLYDCEHCLQLYMLALENTTTETLTAANESFADQVMNAIVLEERMLKLPALPPSRSSLVRLFRKPLFQYAVAAGITLLLMSSGVFQSIPAKIDRFETVRLAERTEPLSQKLMEKAVGMLQTIQSKETPLHETTTPSKESEGVPHD
jgi:anti-sigma factor RsiW